MNSFNRFMLRRRFKIIFAVWIILSVAITLAVSTAIQQAFDQKIKLSYEYNAVKEQINNSESAESVIPKLDSLAQTLPIMKNIIILNKNNTVIHSSSNTNPAWNIGDELNLTESGDYLASDSKDGVLFRLISDSRLQTMRIMQTGNDFDSDESLTDDFFFESEASHTEIYNLSYIADRNTGSKIYFIYSIAPVENSNLLIELRRFTGGLISAIYLVIISLWIYQNALKAKLNAPFWGIVTLCTNLVGVLVYALYKKSRILCGNCGAAQSSSHIYCCDCGEKITGSCPVCGTSIGKNYTYCSKCGVKQKGNSTSCSN